MGSPAYAVILACMCGTPRTNSEKWGVGGEIPAPRPDWLMANS